MSGLRELESQYVLRGSNNEWAWDTFQVHEEAHWLPEEVPMLDDIRNWKEDSQGSQKFLRDIMLFFTQADIEVVNTYLDSYLPYYKYDLPIKTTLASFAAREGIHTKAYAFIVESLALGDGVFSAFTRDPILLSIHRVFTKYQFDRCSSTEDRFKSMVVTSLLGEGTMLFGLFAMLLNYQRYNKYNGTCTIVAWSIRDEDMHVQFICKLIKNDPIFKGLSDDVKQRWFWKVYHELVPLIKQFTTNCFNGSDVQGITLEDTLAFLDFQVGRRVRQSNIIKNYKLPVNPYFWFDQIVGGVEDANFFERRRTEYSKNNLIGEWKY